MTVLEATRSNDKSTALPHKASVVKSGAPIMDQYKGSLGELSMGRNNVSFVTHGQLNQNSVAALLTDIDQTVHADPLGSVEYSTYRIVWSSAQER